MYLRPMLTFGVFNNNIDIYFRYLEGTGGTRNKLIRHEIEREENFEHGRKKMCYERCRTFNKQAVR